MMQEYGIPRLIVKDNSKFPRATNPWQGNAISDFLPSSLSTIMFRDPPPQFYGNPNSSAPSPQRLVNLCSPRDMQVATQSDSTHNPTSKGDA